MSTMPGPPPKGRSSTLLCLPAAQSRMLCRWISTRPRWMASLSRLWVKYPANSSGNRVSTSKRNAPDDMGPLRGRRRLRRGLGRFRFLGLELGHVLLEEHLALLRRQGVDALPVLDPARPQDHAVVGVRDHRVVGAQFFDDAAVARLARVDGHDAEKRAVLAPHLLHADANGHGRVPL